MTGKRWKYEEIVEFVENKGAKLLTKKEEYVNTRVNMEFECQCGEIFTRTFKSFRDNKSYTCRECTNFNLRNIKKLSEKEYLSRCNKHGVTLITPYKNYENNCTKLEFICKCGEPFKRRLADLRDKKDYRCSYCANHHNYSISEIKEIAKSVGDILVSTDYIDNRTKLKFICKCGEPFERSFNGYKDQQQYHCSQCATNSKGELIISSFLKDNKLKFLSQYKFDDCKNINSLPFDFYLPQYNICIEYNGKQHYKYGCFCGNLLTLMNIKYRDNKKIKYCKDNNIKLIIIPYWEYNHIINILSNEIL